MVRAWIIQFVLSVAALAFPAQQIPPDAAVPEPQAVAELRSFLEQVAKAKEAANKAWHTLEASGSFTQSGRIYASSDFVTEWMNTVTPNGPAAAPFYAGTDKTLSSWIEATEKGDDRYPPMDEIRAAMNKWRDQHNNIVDSVLQAAPLERESFRTEIRELRKLKPESPEWVQLREQQLQRQTTLRKVLSEAGANLGAAAAIPAPILPADRSASPFSGPPNPGTPDRLWIYLSKASTLIGESLPVQIGLANNRGPNCAADQNYSVSITCEGCTAKSTEVTIRQVERSTQTEIRITAAKAQVRAQSSRSKPALANAYGCYRATNVTLVSEQDRSTGGADGKTPIPFRFAFHDSNGQRATDGRRKPIAPRLVGVGALVLRSQSIGSVTSKDKGITVPADECISDEGVVSSLVGAAKVSASYKNQQADELQFTFDYAFPWVDKILVAAGALLGFLVTYSTMRRRVLWLGSLLSSLAGAVIGFVIGDLLVLNKTTIQDTWLVAFAFTAAGAMLGGVAMARILFAKFMPAPEDGADGG